ncbi:MAG: creatininase family protein [Devosia sp.]
MGVQDFSQAPWPDVASATEKGVLAVLAIGACEQHGAHLPLTTDTDMAHGVAGRIAGELEALLLPPITYGDAWNSEAFTGTLSLSPATLRAMIEDIGLGVRRMGVHGLIIINGHFGNREPIALAARTLVGAGLPVVHLDYPGMEALAGKICDSAPAAPGFYHADEVETSIMLALRPAAVDMSRAAPEYPEFPPTFGIEPMQLRDFVKTGVFGDPRPSTAAKGVALIAGIVAESIRLVGLWRGHHGI